MEKLWLFLSALPRDDLIASFILPWSLQPRLQHLHPLPQEQRPSSCRLHLSLTSTRCIVPCLSIICTYVNLKARDPRQQFHPPRWPRKYWKEQGSGKQQLTHVLVCKTCQDRTLFNCFYNARLHLLMSCQGTLVMVICLTTGRFWWVHRSGDCSTHSIVRCYNISARLIHFTQQPNLCLITRYLFHNQQVVWEGETVARKSLLFISGHWYRHWKE